MAEYSEVIKQYKRMCKSFSSVECIRGECPMGREFGCANIGQSRKIAFERCAEFEKLVMAWAKDHPEPVYPTWWDWLHEIGVLTGNGSGTIHEPIPADIAQKLGIEPIEPKEM